MIKKIINFFDNHRLVLIITILFIICLLFFSIKTYLFFHYDFSNYPCDEQIDKEYCSHNDITILINPEKAKNTFFKEHAEKIQELKEEYNLPDFNFYTAYYYQIAAQLNYYNNNEEELLNFFTTYVNTYDLQNFYLQNTLFFEIFYNYKIPSLDLVDSENNIYNSQKFYQ